MFATEGLGCPVTIFKEFLSRRLSRRPPEIRTTGPVSTGFVCQILPRKFGTSESQGELNGVKALTKETTLEDSWKTFSNHSARKTVGKMNSKRAGLERLGRPCTSEDVCVSLSGVLFFKKISTFYVHVLSVGRNAINAKGD